MINLSFQKQQCHLTLEQGLEEYHAFLKANGKKQLIDTPGSTVIRDHDATHVIFGLDTSLEEESLLDSWVFSGTEWKLKQLLAYNKLPELKDLKKAFWKDPGYLKLGMVVIRAIPLKLKIWKRAKQMKKKWPFASPDYLLAKRICDLREEYGINILTPEERSSIKPLQWTGSINKNINDKPKKNLVLYFFAHLQIVLDLKL